MKVGIQGRNAAVHRSRDDAGASDQGHIAVYHSGYADITIEYHDVSADVLVRADGDALSENSGIA
jgi:hypothetical protein